MGKKKHNPSPIVKLEGEARPRLILPRGSESPLLFIVNDSASESERKSGYCFAGESESTIRGLCKDSGLSFQQTYRTLFVKAQTKYNGPNAKLVASAFDESLASFGWDYKEILWQEVQNMRPKLIVPMGEQSFRFFTGEKSLNKFRGSIMPLRPELSALYNNGAPGPKVAPTYSPRMIQAIPENRPVAQVDWNRFNKYIHSPQEFGNYKVSIANTYHKFQEYCTRHQGAEWGVFDIETNFNIPICVGICLAPEEAICIPLVDRNIPTNELLALWDGFGILYRKLRWANQNIKFDIIGLERLGFLLEEAQFLGDTSLNAGILYPEFKKNLGFLNSLYNDIPYFKDEGKVDADHQRSRTQLYEYCAKDCLSTYRIFTQQNTEVKEFKLESFQHEVYQCFWPYVRMEKRGILVDSQRQQALFAKYDTLYQIQRKLLNKLSNSEANPHSPLQMGKLIYGELKFKEKKDRVTHNLLTDEDTIHELLAFEGRDKSIQTREVLHCILACRKLAKVIEYLETPIHPDSRIRCSYNLSGTDTGRSAGGKTTDFLLNRRGTKYILSPLGRSFHQIPKHGFKIAGKWYGKDLRDIYVPTPGYILIEGDLSQAEARVDCILAEDYDLLPKFDTPPGMHVLTGTWIYGREINKKKEPDLYHFAKTVRHAAERNMGEYQLYRLVQEVMPGMDVEECSMALMALHRHQPNIRGVFHTQIVQHIQRNANLISPQGRRRDFFGREGKDLYNAAISQIPQATVSDHIKFSMQRINHDFGSHIHFVYEGHDALMAEIKKDQLERYCEVFRKVTFRPIDFRQCSLSRNFDLRIPCEIAYTEEAWSEMKECPIS